MSKKKKIINYLIQHSNDKGIINKPQTEICKEIGVTDTYIRNVFKDLIKDGVIEKQGKTIIVLDKSKQVVDSITSNLSYSDREKELLQYIYDMYENRDKNFDYVCISRDCIKTNTNIKNGNHISEYINRYVGDGLLETIKGDYTKKQATKYKVLFGSNNNITIAPKTNNIDNTTINSNNNININIPDNTEILNKILNKLTDLEQQNKELKKSLNYHIDRYYKIEGVADMLLKYISELENDIYNIYTINNIQAPKLENKITIRDIRKYLDDDTIK